MQRNIQISLQLSVRVRWAIHRMLSNRQTELLADKPKCEFHMKGASTNFNNNYR